MNRILLSLFAVVILLLCCKYRGPSGELSASNPTRTERGSISCPDGAALQGIHPDNTPICTHFSCRIVTELGPSAKCSAGETLTGAFSSCIEKGRHFSVSSVSVKEDSDTHELKLESACNRESSPISSKFTQAICCKMAAISADVKTF